MECRNNMVAEREQQKKAKGRDERVPVHDKRQSQSICDLGRLKGTCTGYYTCLLRGIYLDKQQRHRDSCFNINVFIWTRLITIQRRRKASELTGSNHLEEAVAAISKLGRATVHKVNADSQLRYTKGRQAGSHCYTTHTSSVARTG